MRLVAFKEELFFSFRHPRVRNSFIGFMLSALLVLIIGVFYWWPAFHAINRLKVEINERRWEISNAEYNIKLAKTSGAAVQQAALIEKKLGKNVTQAILVQNIAALAHRNKVRIISETYKEGKEKEGYLPLSNELSVRARYSGLRGFIAGLQELPTFTIVQKAVVESSSRSSDISAQLNIITYRRVTE